MNGPTERERRGEWHDHDCGALYGDKPHWHPRPLSLAETQRQVGFNDGYRDGFAKASAEADRESAALRAERDPLQTESQRRQPRRPRLLPIHGRRLHLLALRWHCDAREVVADMTDTTTSIEQMVEEALTPDRICEVVSVKCAESAVWWHIFPCCGAVIAKCERHKLGVPASAPPVIGYPQRCTLCGAVHILGDGDRWERI